MTDCSLPVALSLAETIQNSHSHQYQKQRQFAVFPEVLAELSAKSNRPNDLIT